MPRINRSQIVKKGASYALHAYANGEIVIFRDDADCEKYLEILNEALRKHVLFLTRFVLMPERVTMLIRNSTGALSDMMHTVQSRYAKYYRKKYGRKGPVWRARFESEEVKNAAHADRLARSIERLPVEAGLAKGPLGWKYSSSQAYAGHARFAALTKMTDMDASDDVFEQRHHRPIITYQFIERPTLRINRWEKHYG